MSSIGPTPRYTVWDPRSLRLDRSGNQPSLSLEIGDKKIHFDSIFHFLGFRILYLFDGVRWCFVFVCECISLLIEE